MKKPYKILYLNHVSYIGGAEIALLNVLTRLNRDRYTPCILSPPGALSDAVRELEVRWKPIPRLDGLNRYNLFHFVQHLPQLATIIRRETPAIIHANTNFATQHAGPLCYRFRIPTIGHIRDIEPLGRMGRWAVRQSTRLIAISDAVSRYLQAEGIPERQLVRVYDGVDLKQYTPRQNPQPSASVITIGMIGQIGSRKGHHVFLEAAKAIVAKFSNLRIWIVGKESDYSQERYTERLQKYVHEHQLEGYVKFWGFRSDIPDILSRLNILVVPSLQEPFGKIVIEGMAMQKPVIASQVGGIPEIVVHANTGLLVPPNDANALRHALENLLAHPDECERMGQAGRKRVETHFSLERNVRQTEQVYESVIRPQN